MNIFISYAREDLKIAYRLYNDIKNKGIECWLDIEDILPGQNWKQAIKTTIRESQYFIALLSSNSVTKKGYSQKELKIALEILEELPESETFIIPIRIEECYPSSEKLMELNWVDIFPSYTKGFAKLLKVIENNLSDLQLINKKDYLNDLYLPSTVRSYPSKVILDRYYAYDLAAYCSDRLKQSKLGIEKKYGELFTILNILFLLFDKILIENQYASTITWKLNEHELYAFNSLFEAISFSDLDLSLEEKMTIDESIHYDLNDKDMKNIIDFYYSKKPIQPKSYKDLIEYINNCILYSERHSTCICPWFKRMPIFEFKFNKLNRFTIDKHCFDYSTQAIDFLLPNFKYISLDEIITIKNNKRINDFRNKIWTLASDNILKNSQEGFFNSPIMYEFQKENEKLVKDLKPNHLSKIKMAFSWFIPFPLNMLVDLTAESLNTFRLKKYNWLFFLYDNKNLN